MTLTSATSLRTSALVMTSKKGAEVRDRLLAVLLRLLLVDGDVVRVDGILRGRGVDGARVPDEVLEELVRILLKHHEPRGLDDVARVVDEPLAVAAERVEIHGRVLQHVS